MRWRRAVIGMTLLALMVAVAGPASAEVGGTVTALPGAAPEAGWQGHWAKPDIDALIAMGHLSNADGLAAPDHALTMGEAVKLLFALSEQDGTTVEQAMAAGLIKSTDLEGPEIDAVPREVFALWVCRATGQQMMAEYAKILMTPEFKDGAEISPKFRNAVALLQQQRVIQGNDDGNFAPRRALTVAEGYRILHTALTRAETK